MSKKETEEVVEEVKPEEAVETEVEEDPLVALEETREQLKASQEKVLRLAADFENSKKRLQREKETLVKFAEENVLKELLASIDNLERAIEQGQGVAEATGVVEGVQLTLDGLLATLDKFGVKAIESVGETFDPNKHEALAMQESDEHPANTVLNEFQKGYYYKDRLLRAAKVVVTKNSSNGTVDEQA